jgi:hypothetical protein
MSLVIDARYFINSSDRLSSSTSSTDFLVNFQQPLFVPPDNGKVYRLGLTRATFPLTYFTVNTTNDRMLVTETHNGTSKQFNIQLTHGNITPAQVLTNISNSLSASSPNGYTYTLSLSSTTGLATFVFTSSTTTDTAVINSSNDYFTSDDMLGLDPNNDLTLVENVNSISPTIVNFSGLANYTVNVVLPNLSANSTFSSQKGTTANVIASIPIIGGLPFDVYTYTSPMIGFDSMAYSMSMGNMFEARITDTRGLPISLNGKSIQLDLVIYH